MNFGQCQPPIWCTLNHKTTQICWLTNMEYRHLNLWLLYCCLCCCQCYFCPHKCTSLITLGHVVCPNILKCQFRDSRPPCNFNRIEHWIWLSHPIWAIVLILRITFKMFIWKDYHIILTLKIMYSNQTWCLPYTHGCLSRRHDGVVPSWRVVSRRTPPSRHNRVRVGST